MTIPKFTALASLYRTKSYYHISSSSFANTLIVDSVEPAYQPSPEVQGRCNDCIEGALTAGAVCLGTGTAICTAACLAAGPFFPACFAPCLGGVIVGCDGEVLTHTSICLAGPRCCPKRCGPPDPLNLAGSGCCDATDQCVNQNDPNARQGCCPSSQAVCGGNCCLPGEFCCGDKCCPQGHSCQQGVCCPPDRSTVCNGICCAGPCDQNGTCCESPSHICGGTCCPPFNKCCNGQCCDLDQECHPTLGTCCSKICGPTCCNANEFCRDSSRGICGVCAAGEHSCSVAGEPSCCPDGTQCCKNGQCCPPDTCCFNGNCLPKSSPACTPR